MLRPHEAVGTYNENNEQAIRCQVAFGTFLLSVCTIFCLPSGFAGCDFVCFAFGKLATAPHCTAHSAPPPRQHHKARVSQHTPLHLPNTLTTTPLKHRSYYFPMASALCYAAETWSRLLSSRRTYMLMISHRHDEWRHSSSPINTQLCYMLIDGGYCSTI